MKKNAGQLLREARLRAGLSQAELAQRAGAAQSVISTYEADKREPGLRTLNRLVEATGHQLSIDIDARPHTSQAGRLSEPLLEKRLEVIKLAAARGVRNIRVFGSVARGQETENSDIDLLVDLDPGVNLLDLVGLERELAELLGAPVDVVPEEGLKKLIRAEVLAEAAPL